MGSAEWLDPVNEQLSQELRFAKSVLRGMIEKGAIDPSIQSGARYFFKEEEPGGFEDTLNFDHTGLPVHDMMQHSEVEDSIEVFIQKREFIDTTNLKNNATLGIVCESLLRAANLLRVEVESVDLTCAELLQQYLHSNTPSAPDIEYARTVKSATQLPKERPLVETLHERPRWIVHEQPFHKVKLHASALVITKQRTNGVMRSSRSTVRPASWARRSHSSLE